MNNKITVIRFAVTLIIASGLMNNALAVERALPSLYEDAKLATVELLVDGHLAGSGCFVDSSGTLITAAHVFNSPGRKIEVLTASNGRYIASVTAVDLGHDLALLQIDPKEEISVLPVAQNAPVAGEPVFLVSSPVFRHKLLQRGMVARNELTFEHQSHFVEVIQIAAEVQPGTSGGPWLNQAGEIIGVQSGAVTANGQPAGIANVAPLLSIQNLIRAKTHSSTATIGLFVDEIWLLQSDNLKQFPEGLEGVVIQDLVPNAAAANAGLKKGEVITAVGGKPFRFRDEFLRLIRAKNFDEAIALTVSSPNVSQTRKVQLRASVLESQWHSIK